MRALKERLVKLIEGNWRERAEVLLNERKMAAEKGKGKLKVSLCLFEVYITLICAVHLSFSSSDTLIVTRLHLAMANTSRYHLLRAKGPILALKHHFLDDLPYLPPRPLLICHS